MRKGDCVDTGGLRTYYAAMQRSIPDAQLAVVPGADHGFPMHTPELVRRPMIAFIAEAR